MKSICIWCHRELSIFPEEAIIPYVARGEQYICFSCIKHLSIVLNDQEKRHGIEEPLFCETCQKWDNYDGSGSKHQNNCSFWLANCCGCPYDAVVMDNNALAADKDRVV